MELYILNGRIVWYANDSTIKLFLKKKRKRRRGRGTPKAEDSGCCADWVTMGRSPHRTSVSSSVNGCITAPPSARVAEKVRRGSVQPGACHARA